MAGPIPTADIHTASVEGRPGVFRCRAIAEGTPSPRVAASLQPRTPIATPGPAPAARPAPQGAALPFAAGSMVGATQEKLCAAAASVVAATRATPQPMTFSDAVIFLTTTPKGRQA